MWRGGGGWRHKEKVEKEKAPLSGGQKSKETETEENKDSQIPGGSLDLLKFSYHIQIGNSPLRVTRCPWEAPAGGQPAEEMKELSESSRASLPSTLLSSSHRGAPGSLATAPQAPWHAAVLTCSSYGELWGALGGHSTNWAGLNGGFLLHPARSCHNTAAPSPRELWGQPQCLLSSRHEEARVAPDLSLLIWELEKPGEDG